MKHFQPLTVLSVRREAIDAFRVSLDAPAGVREQFAFRAGQHLPLRAKVNGRTLQRTYSICSPPGVWPLELGIRVQPAGRFSEWVSSTLSAGDELLALPPVGSFTPARHAPPGHRVAFAAGSGITPVLAIMSHLLSDPRQRFTLFYANRTLASTMFVEELYDLKNHYLDRLSLHFVFSREPQGEALYEGRLDGERVTTLWQAFCGKADADVAEVFVCGPEPMAQAVCDALDGLGVDPARVHSERFRTGNAVKRPVRADRTTHEDAQADQVRVELIMDGKRRQFTMAATGGTVLEGAERAGIDLPYACRGGVCSTCRTHVREGSVAMAVNYALEPWEVERGFVLACQAKPASERLVLDYDHT